MRRNMEKNIKSVTEMLQLGNCSEDDINYAIQYLIDCDIASISEDRLDVANLYYEILKQIPNVYSYGGTAIPETVLNNVRLLFDNIQGICGDPTSRERQEVSFSVIEFLTYLRRHNSITGDNDFSQTEESIETVNDLKADLGTIQYIFDIKVDEQLYFPIENMLVSVINDEQFVNDISNIDSGHIKVLYLAVRFFDEEEQKKQILTNIVERCRLKFIEYMQEQSELLDTLDLHNYRKNGVITFVNYDKRKILIRHNDDRYFAGAENVQHELSYKGDRIIGSFVEMDIPEGAVSVTFDEVMLKYPDKRKELLKLFCSGYRNIFGKYYLMEQDGSFFAVNAFANQDRYIVDDADEFAYDDMEGLFERYYNLSIEKSANCALNRLTVGTMVRLLQIDETPKQKLFELQYNESEFYQNQLIMNWLAMVRDKMHAMRELTGTMYNELKYCIRRKNVGYRDEVSIGKHRICTQRFLPFFIDLTQLLCVLNECFEEKKGVVHQAAIRLNQDGTKEIIITEQDPIQIIKEDKIVAHQLKLEELDMHQQCYVILDEDGCAYLEEQQILKMIYGLQDIVINCLDYDTARKVDMISYNEIKLGVELHEKGLSDVVSTNIFPEICFEEQFFYRLIHNMIYYGIHSDNVKEYLKIFKGHQLLTFRDIKHDEVFQMKDKHTLYVPKDSYREDSTLGNIYTDYLKQKSTRDGFRLYNSEIKYDSQKQRYLLNGRQIQHIVFLIDNFEKGSGTTVMLSAYLNLQHPNQNAVINAKKRIQAYTCYEENDWERRLELSDVIEKNHCDITVHAYYGTMEGKTRITDFLHERGYQSVQVTFQHIITRKIKQIKESVKTIWDEYEEENDEKYAVIREFNMTKANVFPDEMLKYPERSICMYLLKEEKRNKFKQTACAGDLRGLDGLKQYFRKNGIKENDDKTNVELYLFSTLPPAMRIEVLEDYLQQECNFLVMDKLSKAYGKANQLEKLKLRLVEWVEKKYIDQDTASIFMENAELLNRHAATLPVAKNMLQARENFENALSVVTQSIDGEFKEIMQSIFN